MDGAGAVEVTRREGIKMGLLLVQPSSRDIRLPAKELIGSLPRHHFVTLTLQCHSASQSIRSQEPVLGDRGRARTALARLVRRSFLRALADSRPVLSTLTGAQPRLERSTASLGWALSRLARSSFKLRVHRSAGHRCCCDVRRARGPIGHTVHPVQYTRAARAAFSTRDITRATVNLILPQFCAQLSDGSPSCLLRPAIISGRNTLLLLHAHLLARQSGSSTPGSQCLRTPLCSQHP